MRNRDWIVLFVAVGALSLGCSSLKGNVGVDLVGNGVNVTSPAGDLTVSSTGASLDTPAVKAGFTACIKEDGPFAGIFKVPVLGDVLLKFLSCPGSEAV